MLCRQLFRVYGRTYLSSSILLRSQSRQIWSRFRKTPKQPSFWMNKQNITQGINNKKSKSMSMAFKFEDSPLGRYKMNMGLLNSWLVRSKRNAGKQVLQKREEELELNKKTETETENENESVPEETDDKPRMLARSMKVKVKVDDVNEMEDLVDLELVRSWQPEFHLEIHEAHHEHENDFFGMIWLQELPKYDHPHVHMKAVTVQRIVAPDENSQDMDFTPANERENEIEEEGVWESERTK